MSKIALMIEAANTSETAVFRYNPEDTHLHTHRRENLRSYSEKIICLRSNYHTSSSTSKMGAFYL
jgi:hypothetical protein